MNEQEQQYLDGLRNQVNQKDAQVVSANKAANSVFQSNQDVNLIELQIEMDSILEKLDHSMRGHVLKLDGKGNYVWQEPDDSSSKVLSEAGVQALLRILSVYLSRNTILSNYDEKMIKDRVFDIGTEINDLIFTNYEQFFYGSGFDFFADKLGYEPEDEITDKKDLEEINQMIKDERNDKCKFYNILALEIIHSIEAAYLRAKGAGERQSLRKSYMVTQNDSPGMMMPQQKKGFNLLHPIRSLR